MKAFLKIVTIAFFIAGAANTNFMHGSFTISTDNTVTVGKIFFRKINDDCKGIYTSLTTTLKSTGITIKKWWGKPADLSSWSNTIKKVLSHHNDPRLLAIVASLSVVATGGIYMLARKKSKTYEKVIGASCILFSIANIVLSSHWIRLADAYGTNIQIT